MMFPSIVPDFSGGACSILLSHSPRKKSEVIKSSSQKFRQKHFLTYDSTAENPSEIITFCDHYRQFFLTCGKTPGDGKVFIFD
ncbi:MAG TPA: hypothetical protein DCF68_15210 [Cyanothece sp. UBA12306]|nr:hypothetical protein [Cyanothece sp. UBA12306]